MAESTPSKPAGQDGWIRICESTQLKEGGDGVRFVWQGDRGTRPKPAFIVRHSGLPRAYLNECRHVPVELDWPSGQFFDESGQYLVCATHGAIYSAENGRCQGGPCASKGLRKLECREEGGSIWVEQLPDAAS